MDPTGRSPRTNPDPIHNLKRELALMVHQPVEVVQTLADDILVQSPFIFDDDGAIIIVQAESINPASVRLSRNVLGRQKLLRRSSTKGGRLLGTSILGDAVQRK